MHHKIVVEEKHFLVQEHIPLHYANNANNYIFVTESQTANPETKSNSKRGLNVSKFTSNDGIIYSNGI